MERKVDKFLEHWQMDSNRKPLVIYGGKQVGKTYSVLKFGEYNYSNIAYIDSYDNKKIDILKKQNTIEGIISAICEITKENVEKNNTLIVIDNVNDAEIVKTIKTFGKFKNDYHIILITSLRENLSKFKGVELQFKSILPMDFDEYLSAIKKDELKDFIISSYNNNTKNPFHKLSLEYFDRYILTGGMPEAVNMSINEQNMLLLNSVFDKILDSYKKEMSLQDNLIDITRSNEVYNSIPMQLLKSNKKFQYGLIKDGGRSKDYENSLNFLHNNGFIYKCYRLNEVKSPISNFKDKDSFKVYLNDTGLLYKNLKINENVFKNNNDMKQILYENSVAISLISCGYNLYYYQSLGKAFIDFVIQTRSGRIIPIEMVSLNKSKSKALSVYNSKFNPIESIKITRDNFSIKKGVRYIPIYATFCLSELI